MKYHWTSCPRCGCQVTINWSDSPAGISGSLRRWSTDRSINDGRAVHRAASDLAGEDGFAVDCVCGQTIRVPGTPDAVSAERDANLRVDLGESGAASRKP